MNASKKLAALSLALAVWLVPPGLKAADIDLYTGGERVTGTATNVLIVLDNTANFSATNQGFTEGGSPAAQGSIEAQVIIDVLRDLTPDSLNIGLMQYGDVGGGYPIFAVRSNSTTNVPVFEAINQRIKQNVGDPKYKGPTNARYDELFNSIFRYFNGFAPQMIVNARSDESSQGDLRDYDGNSAPVDRSSLGNDGYRTSEADGSGLSLFNGPADAKLGCAKNFVVFIGNSFPSSSATDAKARLVAAGALFDPDVVPETSGISTAESLAQVAPYWTRFMSKYGVKSNVDDTTVAGGKRFNPIQTYTINVCNAGCASTTGQKQASLLQSMANEGQGRYFKSTSKEEIRQAMALIFAEIQAVNSQFAAAALPVSVNARGTFENQVYIGVFRPEASALPRWYGNLKGYKFGGFCDWNKDGIVDSGEPVSEAIGNKPDACRKYCEVDGVAGFTFGTDIGVNDPDQAAATCAAISSQVTDAGGSVLPAEVKTLAIERYDIFLSDKRGELAEDQKREDLGGTGFIRQDAVSYWTRPSSFWNFLQTTLAGASDSPDGPNVERGGAAQRLRNLLETVDGTGAPVVPPVANVAARRVYTCLGCASGTNLSAGGNATSFSTDNTTLVNRLTRVGAISTLSLVTRSGNTLTATTTGNHTFAVGMQVVLSGLSVAQFNVGPVTVTEVPDSTHFSVVVPGLEQPPTSKTGTASVATPRTITSTALEATGWRAKIFGNTTGLANGSRVSISNVGTYFNGSDQVIADLDTVAGSFTVAVRKPVSPATSPGTSTTVGGGSKVYNNLSVRLHDTATGVGVVKTDANLTSGSAANQFAPGQLIEVRGVTPADYNGFQRVIACPDTVDNQTYCFRFPLVLANGTFTPQDTQFPIQVSRALGDETLTAQIANSALAAIGVTLANGNLIYVQGTGETQYDASFYANAVSVGADSTTLRLCRVAGCSDTELTVTLSPATSATGTAGSQAEVYVGGRYVSPSVFIPWVLGKENGTEDENKDGYLSGFRASVHGDVLHSRPLLVSYDVPATPTTPAVQLGIVGFYGGNDGFLRAIKAGTGDNDGTELWSFIPEEFIPDPVSNDGLKRLYHNDKPILYPNLACNMNPPPAPRNYFWDGVITQNSEAADLMGNKRIIYAAMRRGGHAVYAFDVTNPAGNTDINQVLPTFAWKVSNATSGFGTMGQSWSEPKVVVVRADSGARVPVLVMGGGYAPAEDDLPPGATRVSGTGAGGVGRGVYLINPLVGPTAGNYLHLVPPATAGLTQYSIPADVTTLDTNGDGDIDRIYAVDSGGNVFRWTWNPTAGDPFVASAWTFKWVANLSGTGADARRFLSRMAVMPITYKGATGYALMFGSGDREHPLANKRVDTNTLSCAAVTPTCAGYFPDGYFNPATPTSMIEDRFYSVFDLDTVPLVSGAPEFAYPLTTALLHSIIQTSTGTAAQASSSTGNEVVAAYSDTTGKPGWYLGFWNNRIKLQRGATEYSCPMGEEKLVDVPVFSGGFVRFATNSPEQPDRESGKCSNLGQARQYAINPLTGLADGANSGDRFNVDNFSTVMTGGGLPPAITSGVVVIGERYVKFDTRGAGDTDRDPVHASARRNKVYWYYRAD